MRERKKVIKNRVAEIRKNVRVNGKILQQNELAKLIGINAVSVCQIELGNTNGNLETRLQICKIFKKDYKEIFWMD